MVFITAKAITKIFMKENLDDIRTLLPFLIMNCMLFCYFFKKSIDNLKKNHCFRCDKFWYRHKAVIFVTQLAHSNY